ncbi:hypothetical protein BCR39DRAFT_82579 [Naematelia encephala]|uniref:Uncharacterized protein n=1 Tax=Naematelia encephala TaxID=71784 RepID=A0A1Y2BCP1_9TREE|nr:hypothetical protein BCR39DRAFT_82579 [Naematelia encephala]
MPPKTNRITTLTAFKPVYPRRLERTVRPRPKLTSNILPFHRDPAHTIPTKWNLYRSLLRSASSYRPPSSGESSSGLTAVRRKIKETWRRFRGMTSPSQTRVILDRQYTLLDKIRSSDPQLEELDKFYTKVYAIRDTPKAPVPKPIPRLTGGFLFPTYHNPPLPKLHPQPPEISGMIRQRIKARAKIIDKLRRYREWGEDMTTETKFWQRINAVKKSGGDGGGVGGVGGGEGKVADHWTGGRFTWSREQDEHLKPIHESMEKYTARSKMMYDEKTIEKVLMARKVRARVANEMNRKDNMEKRKKQERDQRGELALRESAPGPKTARGAAAKT